MRRSHYQLAAGMNEAPRKNEAGSLEQRVTLLLQILFCGAELAIRPDARRFKLTAHRTQLIARSPLPLHITLTS
jgi:hypothetical protein